MNTLIRISCVCALFLVLLVGCDKPAQVTTEKPNDTNTAVYQYLQLTDSDFIEKTKSGIYLIDFDADWCGWCRKMDPELARFSDQYGDKITIAKIDFDKNPEAVAHFGVNGIPALFLIVDGKQVKHAPGYQTTAQLEELVKEYIQ